MLHKIIKGAAPIAALALGALASGCNGNVSFGDSDGVPLAELDYEGATPDTVALAGPDTVVITEGASLTIAVEGDQAAVDALRFTLEDDTLGISREGRVDGTATVRLTMPSPKALMLAGSGGIAAQTMAADAEIDVAGSGRVDVASLSAQKLEINVAGSGTIGAAGSARELELNLMGSGDAELGELSVETAEVNIMGAGSGTFASDGTVTANIMGSGTVDVIGRATCEVTAMGSGKLNCRQARATSDSEAAE